jgi:hypothetical protein
MKEENKKNIYRLGNTDTWACKECKSKGDKHFKKQHQCKGLLKKQQKKQYKINKKNTSLYIYLYFVCQILT